MANAGGSGKKTLTQLAEKITHKKRLADGGKEHEREREREREKRQSLNLRP